MSHPVTPGLRAIIDRLDLRPHPEGGWYRETHRSEIVLPRGALAEGYPGDRCVVTSILFALPTGALSRLHRVRSEEIWLHHQGDDVRLRVSSDQEEARPAGTIRESIVGQREGAVLQAVVPPGWWQDAEALPGEHGYALVACVVAPGFDFEDFEVVGHAS